MTRNQEEVLTELLVLRSQDGDVPAWRQLVNLWQERLYVHARRATGDHEAAKDITQDAWLSMVAGIHRLDDPAKFRAWAFRIVSNKATDWVRRQARRRKMLEVAKDEAIREENDQVFDGNSNVDIVRRAVRKLSREQRTLLSMFYEDGLEISEIASILQIPTGTVKSRMYSVRQELKPLLENERKKQESP